MLGAIYKLFLKEKFKYHNTKISPGFWAPKEPVLDYDKIYIDLRNIDHAHLGDQIFFISSFVNIKNKENVVFLINKKLKDFYSYFDLKYSFSISNKSKRKSLLITSIKSYIFPLDRIGDQFSKIACYDLTDSKIEKPLYSHIHNSFLNEPISDELIKTNDHSIDINKIHDKYKIAESKYYIFNDILYSRSFLRPFMQKSITKKIKKLKKNDVSIIYVGSQEDSKIESSSIKYVDYDLRGKINLYELNQLISSNECIGFIGFDNAIMHICLMFNKKAYVKFRGRFLKSAYDLHIRSINCAVNEAAKNNIEYL